MYAITSIRSCHASFPVDLEEKQRKWKQFPIVTLAGKLDEQKIKLSPLVLFWRVGENKFIFAELISPLHVEMVSVSLSWLFYENRMGQQYFLEPLFFSVVDGKTNELEYLSDIDAGRLCKTQIIWKLITSGKT